MKRKRNKHLAGLCLPLSAVLSLCACSKNATESGEENDSLAKEHVYQFQEIAIPYFGGDEYKVCASGYRDWEIFLLMKVTDWEHYNDIRILSVGDDESGAAVVPLETVPWNPAAEDSPEISEYS